jgi:hypothetical protein
MAQILSFMLVAALTVGFFAGIVHLILASVQQGRSDKGSASGSIIASSMLEMDRFIRPSTGHIVQAEEEMKHHQDDIGGE